MFARLAFYDVEKEKARNAKNAETPVSIIICARNEAENLKKNLPRILTQIHHSYEVIVINDGSTDDTKNILLNFILKHRNLRTESAIDKPDHIPGKKFALAQGIALAKHDVLLLTDADCCPASPFWLSEMQKAMHTNIEIVLGFGPYEKKKGLLNKFIRYETVYAAVQYLSFALMKIPYMGVGRNLMYKKSLYNKTGGFSSHEKIMSGDDDLFVNAAAGKQNVAIVLNDDAFVYSKPKGDWFSFFIQKKRHLSTAKHYKMKHKVLLGLLSFSHLLHYTGGFLLVFYSNTIFMNIYLVRISLMLVCYYRILKKMKESSLLLWVPFLDALLALYYLVFAPITILGKSQKWK